MKAVIMAGGKGTRLRPLTCNTPKPMVPLLDQPCMEYTIQLLKKHHITDIAVTLQFMPEVIRQYFGDGSEWGVKLHYFEEDEPLGTAGSVKNAEDFLDDTFIVISGDALTDFNLERAVAFHEAKQAVGTILLTRVESPLEFGVVMTDEHDRIIRFLEKPSWGEVFSDTVNTGIYILEPKIFKYIKKDREFDFSKDLFPALMANKQLLSGYVAEGYWSDIGNLTQYRQTQFDMLEGKVQCDFHGTEISTGIWVGESAEMSIDATLFAPCYIGKGCKIEEGVMIGHYTVVGEGSHIKSGANIERTVIGKNTFLERGVELVGATVCKNVTLGSGSIVFEGAAVGDRCKIGMKNIIHSGVKIYPDKMIDDYTILNHSFIVSEKMSKRLFGKTGIKGICNSRMSSRFANRLALAYGSTQRIGSTVAIGHDNTPFSLLLAESFASGLHETGIHTCHFDHATSSITRYGIPYFDCSGGISIRRCSDRDDEYLIEFYDEKGLMIGKSAERKIENCYDQEDFRLVMSDRLGHKIAKPEAAAVYCDHLIQLVNQEKINDMNYKVVVQNEGRNLRYILTELLEKLGCRVIQLNTRMFDHEDIAKIIRSGKADFGIVLDSNAQQFDLITEQGNVVSKDKISLLQLMIQIYCEDKNTLHIPVDLPDIAELLAKQLQRNVVRTKVDRRTIMQGCEFSGYHLYFDGLYSLVQVMHMMAMRQRTLTQLVESIPNFTLMKKQVECPWSEKGKVMRFLMEDTKGKHVELIDGIKVYHDNGWTLILPDGDEPSIQIYANARNPLQAEELSQFYAKKILDCYQRKQFHPV